MRFANFHTHVLYGVDDGPNTLTESIALAKAVLEEGCDRLVITPHFNGNIHDFAKQTALVEQRFAELKSELAKQDICFQQLVLGYEVRYFRGISRSESLPMLCMGDSRLLLLELEPGLIDDTTVAELQDLHYNGYTVLLAHLERYTKCNGFSLLHPLLENESVIAQVNAGSCLESSLRRSAFRLLKTVPGAILSSDAHSVATRPPLLRPAYVILQKRFGEDQVCRLIQNGDRLFETLKGQ